jgi:hypothetical protein
MAMEPSPPQTVKGRMRLMGLNFNKKRLVVELGKSWTFRKADLLLLLQLYMAWTVPAVTP